MNIKGSTSGSGQAVQRHNKASVFAGDQGASGNIGVLRACAQVGRVVQVGVVPQQGRLSSAPQPGRRAQDESTRGRSIRLSRPGLH